MNALGRISSRSDSVNYVYRIPGNKIALERNSVDFGVKNTRRNFFF